MPLVNVILEHGVAQSGKALMAMIGVDCGPTRPPIRPLSPGQQQAVYEAARKLDVFSAPLSAPA